MHLQQHKPMQQPIDKYETNVKSPIRYVTHENEKGKKGQDFQYYRGVTKDFGWGQITQKPWQLLYNNCLEEVIFVTKIWSLNYICRGKAQFYNILKTVAKSGFWEE